MIGNTLEGFSLPLGVFSCLLEEFSLLLVRVLLVIGLLSDEGGLLVEGVL